MRNLVCLNRGECIDINSIQIPNIVDKVNGIFDVLESNKQEKDQFRSLLNINNVLDKCCSDTHYFDVNNSGEVEIIDPEGNVIYIKCS